MSGGDGALRVVLGTSVLGLTLTAAGAAPRAERAPDMAHCAGITAPDRRLACYDALGCGGIIAADQRLACYDALAKSQPSRLQAGPAEAAREAKSFGLSTPRPPAPPEGPKLIQALVTQVTVDRLGNVLMALDNGQSWSFNDPDALFGPGDSVTIRRAALGSFVLMVRRHSYRARRVQ